MLGNTTSDKETVNDETSDDESTYYRANDSFSMLQNHIQINETTSHEQ